MFIVIIFVVRNSSFSHHPEDPIQYSFIKNMTKRTQEKETINMNDEMIKYKRVNKK